MNASLVAFFIVSSECLSVAAALKALSPYYLILDLSTFKFVFFFFQPKERTVMISEGEQYLTIISVQCH